VAPTSKPPLPLSFVPRLAKKARLRFDRHSGGHMIVYPERGLALNESAAEIAKRCDGTRSVERIIEELVSARARARLGEDTSREAASGSSANDGEEIRRDVVAFVEELAKKGLLEP
jgi:coenzyme PQQ biosynthesis protein PqqD